MKKPLRRKPRGWRRKASIERSHTSQSFSEPDRWEHVPVAPMRSPIVVEVYDPRQQIPCDHHVRGAFHPVEPFLLDDAVDPLGDRVVGRLVVLRHADRGFNGLLTINILITTILNAAVGVVDQSIEPQG